MLDERSDQMVSVPVKENVESMLNESLNHFKFDSTNFQKAFNIFYAAFNKLNDLFKSPRH